MSISIFEYQTSSGVSTFAAWFNSLYASAAARISTALARLAAGNSSNVKSLGRGVSELKIDFGPG
jgi:putative addiction module killer protein